MKTEFLLVALKLLKTTRTFFDVYHSVNLNVEFYPLLNMIECLELSQTFQNQFYLKKLIQRFLLLYYAQFMLL